MAQSQDHFEGEFEPHTRLKHLILRTYFQAWARKLLLRPGATDTIFYVDACAGEGMDDAGNHGSPVLAAREAAIVEGQLRDQFGRDVHVRVIAIEKKPKRHKVLAENLKPFGDRARALRGTLGEHFDALTREFGDAPVLFFIDPFGIEPLKADLVRRALARDRAEVFLLFAEQAALRHYGIASAVEEDSHPEPEYTGSLFEPTEQERRAEQVDRESRAEARRDTAIPCIEIMNAAFDGDQWFAEMQKVSAKRRRERALELYEEFLYKAGASHVLRIPVRSDANRHVYHLFHATKSKRGYRAMKEAVDAALKKAPVGITASETIRFQIRSNMHELERQVRKEFAGKTVRWGEDDKDKRQPSIKRFALEETPAYPSELNELRLRLAKLKTADKVWTYRFPAFEG